MLLYTGVVYIKYVRLCLKSSRVRGCKKIKYAGVAELAASRTSAPEWRGSEFEKAHKQGELRRNGARRLCLKSSRVRGCKKIKYAGVAELADAQDLGSCVNSCRFKSCHPHQKIGTQMRTDFYVYFLTAF